MTVFEPIYTERLILREFETGDWQGACRYLSDPEVLQYMEYYPGGEDQAKTYVNTMLSMQKEEPRKHIKLACVLRQSGEVIGECGLVIAGHEENAGLCFRFSRAFWGRGYASEAARAVIAFGIERLRLHRISAACDSRNLAAIRVAEKAGMIREGCLREHKWVKDDWIDSTIFSILEHEYRAKKTGEMTIAV